MKVTIEFNLPSDQKEYCYHMLSEEMACVIAEVYENIRRQLKHGDPVNDRETLEKIQEIVCDTYWKVVE